MRAAALRTVAQDSSLLRVVLSFGAFATAEAAMWIAVFVYAYEHGGVVEVGLVAFFLLAPAAVLAPVAAPLGDRFRRDRALAASYVAQAACLAAAAVAAGSGSSRFVIYTAAAAVCLATAFTRPAIGALLPSLAREPEHLTAANVAIGALENVGGLLGPLAAAGLLLVGHVAVVFGVMALLMTGAFLTTASLAFDRRLSMPLAQATSLGTAISDGLRFLRRDLNVLLLVTCAALPCLLLGAIEVLVVAVATEQLGKGTHFAGYLTSTFAVGGLVGAAAAVLMIGQRGLALALCLGGLLAGTPIALLSAAAVVPVAVACLLFSGAGHTFGRVVGITLLQRAAPDRFRASVFGVLEGFETATLALGGLTVSALSAWVGLHGTLIVVGVFLPVSLLLSVPRLLAIDAGARAPETQVLDALRRDPIFAPLAPPDIEGLATRASIVQARAGETLTREGEAGDRYYCVLDGDLEVLVKGRLLRTLGRGDAFGEIALLHAIPRTATVVARGPATLVAVEGIDFLETVTRHPQSLDRANAGAQRMLGEQARAAESEAGPAADPHQGG